MKLDPDFIEFVKIKKMEFSMSHQDKMKLI